MKVDVDINHDTESFLITFNVKNFKSDRDYEIAHELVSCVCGDYNIDPELSVEDIIAITQDAKDKKAEEFIFEITEDGLEAEILSE